VDLIRLEGLRVVRDGVPVLDGVHWTVRSGERWVLLGSNGAGKTTLLHALADHAQCDNVGLVGGLEVPPGERVIDVVLTGCYGLLSRGGEAYDDADEVRAAALLARLGCRALRTRTYGSLSEGERRRVLIARALMADPEVLLLDEPAAGLDLAGREALLHWLTRLAGQPSAPVTVLVTHHVEEIPAGTTHALLLRAGRVVAAGPATEVLTGPKLSSCFGLPVHVARLDGRWVARLAAAG
jgi:iron complex transport system ATP-binding protein